MSMVIHMKLSPLARDLYEEIAELPVIDAHEHLPSEADYLAHAYSGVNMFAGGYVWHDLESASMSPEFKATMREGGDRPVEEWWPQIRPYWPHVRHTTYARALLVTVRDLYGIADINDDTIGALAERVKADNTPGLYQRVLGGRCRIEKVITCDDIPDRAAFPDDPLLCGLTLLEKDRSGRESLPVLAARSQRSIRTLADAAEAAQAVLRRDLARGAKGFKLLTPRHDPPDAVAAARELGAALRVPNQTLPTPALRDYLFDRCLDVAAEAGVPVAVHTGYWGDFRQLDPKHLFSYAMRRRDVHFDMFHLGFPMIGDAIVMGKTQPNITLNLTWCTIISQTTTAQALDEMIDMVPMNKIIAFGGDYRVAVQKVYGHLVLAREVVAQVLADRIEVGDFDRPHAVHLARLWFHDNPARIYKL